MGLPHSVQKGTVENPTSGRVGHRPKAGGSLCYEKEQIERPNQRAGQEGQPHPGQSTRFSSAWWRVAHGARPEAAVTCLPEVAGGGWADAAAAAACGEMAQKKGRRPALFKARVQFGGGPGVVRDKHRAKRWALDEGRLPNFSTRARPQYIARCAVEKAGTASDQTIEIEAGDPLEADQGKAGGRADGFTAFLFDEYTSLSGALVRARDAARHLSKRRSRPVSASPLFKTSGQDAVGFKDNREELDATLLKRAGHTGGQGQSRCPNMTIPWADQIVNKHNPTALEAVNPDVFFAGVPEYDADTARDAQRLANLAGVAGNTTRVMRTRRR